MSTSDTRSKLFLRHVGTWSNTETYLRYDTVTHMIDNINYVFYAITDITDMTEPSLDATEPWHVMLMGRENLVNGSLVYRDFHGAQIPIQPTENTVLSIENGIPTFVDRTQFTDESMPILTGASVLFRPHQTQLHWNNPYNVEFANDILIDDEARIFRVPDNPDVRFDRIFCDGLVIWLIDSNDPTEVYYIGAQVTVGDIGIRSDGVTPIRGFEGHVGSTGSGLPSRSFLTNRYETQSIADTASYRLVTQRMAAFNADNLNVRVLKVVGNNISGSRVGLRTADAMNRFGIAYYIEETQVDDMGMITGGRVYLSSGDDIDNTNLRAGLTGNGSLQEITQLGTGIRDGGRTIQGVWFRSEREIFGFGRTLDVTGVGDTNTATVTRLFSFPEDITFVYIQDVNTVAMGGYIVFGAGQAAHIGVSIDGDLTRNLSSQPSPVIPNPTYVDGGGATVSRSFAKIESFFMRSSVALMADGTIYISGYFRDSALTQIQYTTFTHLELDFLVRDLFVFNINHNIFVLLGDDGRLYFLFGDVTVFNFNAIPQLNSTDLMQEYTAGGNDLPVYTDVGYTGQVVGLQFNISPDGMSFYTNHGYKYISRGLPSRAIGTEFQNDTSNAVATLTPTLLIPTSGHVVYEQTTDVLRARRFERNRLGQPNCFQCPSLRNIVLMDDPDE